MWLQTRMYLLVGLLFGLLYALMVVISHSTGMGSLIAYAILAAGMLLVQYLIGPKIIEWSMKVKYVSDAEAPELHQMVADLAKKAGIKKPRVAVSSLPIPNAFAFGRSISDGRVCVTKSVVELLSRDELSAVLGHEIAHIKNRDVAVMTLLSVAPMICWYTAWSLMYAPKNTRDGGNIAILGIFALLAYYISNILILYGSRIREYYADRGSVSLGNSPHHLATALYKIVYCSARTPDGALRQVQGYAAFFLNDPGKSTSEIRELTQIDSDLSGTITRDELISIRNKNIKISPSEKITELFSTHPSMLKRVKNLSELREN